jgi:hypothetical protein
MEGIKEKREGIDCGNWARGNAGETRGCRQNGGDGGDGGDDCNP